MGAKYSGAKRRPTQHRSRKRGNPLTSTADYDADEAEFLKAINKYKREKGRPFPSYSEILGVLKKLGWRKEKPIDTGR